jgi:hypothetical protein
MFRALKTLTRKASNMSLIYIYMLESKNTFECLQMDWIGLDWPLIAPLLIQNVIVGFSLVVMNDQP